MPQSDEPRRNERTKRCSSRGDFFRQRPGEAGTPARHDHEYERNGVSNLFMLFAPLAGWRRVEVTDRRTKTDWAGVIRQLVDEDFPDKRVVLVMDNLNTHAPGSLNSMYASTVVFAAYFIV